MLKGQLAQAKGEVLNVRGKSIQYNIFQREVDSNRSIYDALLQRYKEVGVASNIGTTSISVVDKAQPVAIIAFDLLRDGDEDIRGLPLTERRARLESRLGRPGDTLRISEQVGDDGRALHERALGEGWEGLTCLTCRPPRRFSLPGSSRRLR